MKIMAFPLEPMPTLRQFVDAAVNEGCKEHYREIRSSHGTICGRHLTSPDGNVFYPLPLNEETRLEPELMASISQATGTQAFIHLYQHLL